MLTKSLGWRSWKCRGRYHFVIANPVTILNFMVNHHRFSPLGVHGDFHHIGDGMCSLIANLMLVILGLIADLLGRFRPVVDDRKVAAIEVQCSLVMNP